MTFPRPHIVSGTYTYTAIGRQASTPLSGERGACCTVSLNSFLLHVSPTVVPEDMDHMAITMEVLNVAPKTYGGPTTASSSEDRIQEVSSDAEVRFCFSAVE
jgi:hypothetical protein